MATRKRASRWCFTLNNYTADEVEAIERKSSDRELCTYIVYGKEVGESNTPHLQGYLELVTRRDVDGEEDRRHSSPSRTCDGD